MANEGIEIEVYRFDDPGVLVGVLPYRQNPQFLKELGGNGGGSLQISTLDPKVVADPTLLDYRNILKVRINGVIRGAFLIKNKKTTVISEGEYAGEYIEVSGPTLKEWFNDAIVKPFGGLKRTSSDNRAFNFASERGDWYNTGDWINPIIMGEYGDSPWYKPSKWPEDSTAKWVWGANYSSGSAPDFAVTLFRYEFEPAVDNTWVFYVAADDWVDVYLDGAQIVKTDQKSAAFYEATRIQVDLPAGPHVLAFKVQNHPQPTGNPASLMVGGYTLSGEVETKQFQTGDFGWKCMYQPDPYPGWTAGEIILSLLDEAEDRGVLFPTWIIPTFTSTHDSNGNLWSVSLDWSFSIGEKLSSVLAKLEEFGIYLDIDPDTYEANMYTSMGRDRTDYEYDSGVTLTNIALNPKAQVNTTGYTNNGLATISRWVTTTHGTEYAARFTRTATGAIRCKYVGVSLLNNTQYSIHISIRSNKAITGTINLRPDTDSSTGQINLGSVSIPANTATTFTYVATTTANGWTAAASGIAFVTSDGEVGDWIELGAISIVPGNYPELAYFDGDDPAISNPRYSYTWDGTPNASTSTVTIRNPIPGSEPVIFERGKNLRQASSEGVGKVINSLAVKTDSGWLLDGTENIPSISKYGVIEDVLETDASEGISSALTDLIFAQHSTPEEGATYDIVALDYEPFVDYDIGDWVLAPNDRGELVPRRVMSISVNESESGLPLYAIEFDTIFQDNEARLGKAIEKLGGSGAGSGLSNGSPGGDTGKPLIIAPGSPPLKLPLAPSGLAATSIGKWQANGVAPYSEVTLTWNPVTANTDGSATIPQFYEVWGHLSGASDDSYVMFALVTTNTAIIRPFEPSSAWVFRVRALNDIDRVGAFSSTITHTMTGPTTPMPAPTAPVLTSDKGVLSVEWDGVLILGGSPPPQFRYIYIELATASGGPWTKYGPVITRDGRLAQIAGLIPGQTYWVRLTAVDGVGIESAKSSSSSHTLTGIDLGSLDQDVADAIQAAQDAADAAQLTGNTAISAAATADGKAVAAQTTADGKNKSYYQTSMPTGGIYSVGDLWFDSDDGNKPHRYNGTTFVAIQDAAIGTAQTTASNAQAAAVAAQAVADNLLAQTVEMFPNASFEKPGLEGWTADSSGTMPTSSTLTPRTGLRSVNFPGSVNAGIRPTAYFTKPAEERTYRVSAWFVVIGSSDVRLTLVAVDGTGSNIAGTASNHVHAGSTIYTLVTRDITIPAAYTEFSIRFGRTTSYATTMRLDDVSMRDVTEVLKAQATADAAALAASNAAIAAGTAQSTADGKNRVWYLAGTGGGNTTGPAGTAHKIDDIWFNTAKGNQIARWSGSAWVVEELGTDSLGNEAITAAKIKTGTITAASGVIGSIDAAVITVGTLSADRLAALSISATKLMLSDTTNLIENPNPATSGVLANIAGWTAVGTDPGIVAASTSGGPGIAFRVPPNFGTQVRIRNSYVAECLPGDNFLVKVRTQNLLGGPVQIMIVWRAKPTTIGGTGGQIAVDYLSIPSGTAWSDFSWQITAPSNAFGVEFNYSIPSTTDVGSSAYAYFINPVLRRSANAELIVDGAITAQKMAVGTITAASGIISSLDAGVISTGTLNAARLAANSITTDKLLIGNFTNLLQDASFESNSSLVWTLNAGQGVTNSTAGPRTGSRHLRIPATSAAYQAVIHDIPIPVEVGEEYTFGAWVRSGSTFAAGAIELSVQARATLGGSTNSQVVTQTDTLNTSYRFISGTWVVPANMKYAYPRVVIRDIGGSNVYYVDDLTFYKRIPGSLVVDGSITSLQLSAESVTAGKLAAGSVAAVNIQASAVTAEKLAADSVTANAIKAGEIQTNHIAAGAITASLIAAGVGGQLDISANDSINLIVGQITDVSDDLGDTNTNLAEMQTYYNFGTNGAVISKPGSPFSLALRSDRIEMLENGNVVSYWNSGQMYVTSFIGEQVVLGNHKIEKYGTGTVVRAL